MAQDIIKQALDAATSFKARGIKKAALAVVADFEAKKAAPPQDEDQPSEQWREDEERDRREQELLDNARKQDDSQVERTEPAAPATPPAPPTPAQPAQPAQPAAQPATPAPAAPAPEPEAEPEESEEQKEARMREELDTELGDDDLVTAVIEIFKEENVDLDDYGIKVELESNNLARIDGISGDYYYVAKTEEDAEAIALAQVKQDLESEPEIFNQDWLESYIDTDNLRDQLMSDMEEDVRNNPDSYGWDPTEDAEGNEIVRYNAEGEEDDEGEFDSEGQPFEEQTEPSDEWVEAKAAERLKDPVEYLADIYGKQDAVKEAMRIAGLNIDEAASDAVAADGWQHFLCRYDGNSYDLPSGGVYWRS